MSYHSSLTLYISDFLIRTEPIPRCYYHIYLTHFCLSAWIVVSNRKEFAHIHLPINIIYWLKIYFPNYLNLISCCTSCSSVPSYVLPLVLVYPHIQLGRGADLEKTKTFLLVKLMLSRGSSHVCLVSIAVAKGWAEVGVPSAFSSCGVLDELQLLPDSSGLCYSRSCLGNKASIYHTNS